MSERANTGVRFLRYWRGRAPGTVDSGLIPNIADVLVRRRIAEYCPADALSEPAKEASPSAATAMAPQVQAPVQSPASAERPSRKRR